LTTTQLPVHGIQYVKMARRKTNLSGFKWEKGKVISWWGGYCNQ